VKDFALKMPSMFVSTYECESTFSTKKQVKSKTINRMTDETLDDSFGLAANKTGTKDRYCQRSSDHKHPTDGDL